MTEWLTVEEAAERLKVGRATIYRWAKAGRLKIYKLGPKSARIKSEEIDRFESEAPALYESEAPNGGDE